MLNSIRRWVCDGLLLEFDGGGWKRGRATEWREDGGAADVEQLGALQALGARGMPARRRGRRAARLGSPWAERSADWGKQRYPVRQHPGGARARGTRSTSTYCPRAHR